eukprot:765214-Hanusia_phi.AAC.6
MGVGTYRQTRDERGCGSIASSCIAAMSGGGGRSAGVGNGEMMPGYEGVIHDYKRGICMSD